MKLLHLIGITLLPTGLTHADILYEDHFDDDTLPVNAGTGGGAINRTIQAHSWADNGDATFNTSGTSYTRRALMYSANTFQSDTGFVMTVNFTTGSIGDTAAHNLSLGLISNDTDLSTYTGYNPFRVDTSVYSIGANVTTDGSAATQGLNFTSASVMTTLDQSGTHAQFQAGQTCEVTIEIGIGGYWCYRIDGVYEASGILLEGFDLTKNYHVAIYGQDDNGGGKSINSVKLEKGYAVGERAESVRGTWSAAVASANVDQVKDFKTLDTLGVSFTNGASLSAEHKVPLKLFDELWQGDTDVNGDPINNIAPVWGDLTADEPDDSSFLEEILGIKAAGFKVKAYTNSENFVGTNTTEQEVFVQRWIDYCDTDAEVQAFINSQPFHTGVWNSTTEQYEVAYESNGTETYPYRKYMFCYAEYILKEYALQYGKYFNTWIFDDGGTMGDNGDNASSGVLEEQRIYQAYARAVHAGNPDIAIAFNNGRSTLSYDAYPYAIPVYFDDFTFGHAFGGNNDHADKESGRFARNYRHIERMTDKNGYVHDGGNWTWDDLIVGNLHTKLATTAWTDGPNQAWEQDDFNQWTLEAVQAGGSLTWDGSLVTSLGITQLRGWAYDLFKNMDDHLAEFESPGPPSWARAYTVLPDATAGQAYYHVLQEEIDLWDPEGDEITDIWFFDNAPSWLSISEDLDTPGNWVMSGIPTETDSTLHSFGISARDSNSNEGTRAIELQVNEGSTTFTSTGNGSPVWISDPLILPNAYKHKEYYYLIKRGQDVEDFEGDTLTLEIANGVDWLSLEKIAPDVWSLSGTPSFPDHGIHTIDMNLSDGNQTTEASIQISVTNAQYLDMQTNSINGGAFWTNLDLADEDEDLTYNNSGNNFNYRALSYSTQSFQSDDGFKLTINYTTGSIGDSLAHNLAFGFISTDTDISTYTGLNPFKIDTSVYSLGVNLTADGDATARGLNFTNGSVRTTLDQSGDNTQFAIDTTTEVVLNIGRNGTWSYSIGGIEEASGVIPEGFDLNKSYHVAIYGQDDNGNGKSIQSISLDANESIIPVADPKTESITQNSSLGITLSGSSSNDNSLTFEVITLPANGSLSGTLPTLTYEPDEDYVGYDSFTYRCNNGLADSEIVAVSIAVGVTPGLLAQWAMDDASGTLVFDSSGSGFHGTLAKGTWISGVEGGALDLNGTDTHVSFPVSAFSALTNEISISFWAYGDTTQPRVDSILSATDLSGNRVLNIHLPSTNAKVFWDAGNSNSSSYDRTGKVAKASEYKERWNHWIFVKSATVGEMNIYLNGSLWEKSTGRFKAMTGIASAMLGSDEVDQAYDGSIDEVKLYNIALSPSEITSLYEEYGGYHKWISEYPDLEDPNTIGDSDHDNIPTLLEYVLNGDPQVSDPYILPVHDTLGGDIIFRFTVRVASTSDTSQVFQYSNDLDEWHDVDISSSTAPEVSLGIETDGAAEVEITLNPEEIEGDKIFGRLKVNSN
ncbi:MAG: LamG-like jellyroll fold domain-containing protein [Akkermansiaceae bacterium]